MSQPNERDTTMKPTPKPPGVCIDWQQKLAELPPITGDAGLVKQTWQDIDALAYTYIWHCLVSF